MAFDIDIGSGTPTGFDIVISGSGGFAGSALDVQLPDAVDVDSVLVIFAISDGDLYISDPGWDLKAHDGVGGLYLSIWAKAAVADDAGAVVSVISLTEQKLQGGVFTMANARPWNIVASIEHAAHTEESAFNSPSIAVSDVGDVVAVVVSTDGLVTLDLPAGVTASETQETSGGSDRTAAIFATEILSPGQIGTFAPGIVTSTPDVLNAGVWTIRLKHVVGSADTTATVHRIARWTPVVLDVQVPFQAEVLVYMVSGTMRQVVYDSTIPPSELATPFSGGGFAEMFAARSTIVELTNTRRRLSILPNGGWWTRNFDLVPFVVHRMEEKP